MPILKSVGNRQSRSAGHVSGTYNFAKSHLQTIATATGYTQAVMGALVDDRNSLSYFRRRMFAALRFCNAAVRRRGTWPTCFGGAPAVSLAGSTEMENSHYWSRADGGSGRPWGSNPFALSHRVGDGSCRPRVPPCLVSRRPPGGVDSIR